VFDNFSTGKRENLSVIEGQIDIMVGDLREQKQVAQAVTGIDIIFHHGAFISVPVSMKTPQECFDVNVQGTINLLEAARETGVKCVVVASSAAVYGDSQSLPLKESSSLRSLSPYAASKQMKEVLADLFTRVFDLPVISLRYFNVYGPRQSPDSPYAAVIPIFSRKLLTNQPPTVFGDGNQVRDFIYVGDVVRANILASENPLSAGKSYNICNGKETSILDLLAVLYELIPDAPEPEFGPPRSGDIYRSLGDPTQAAQDLGFQAETTLSIGLSRTVDWLRE
jgi:UDP-glucose 4-epimerase